MKIKTNTLIGPALDWAVAKAEVNLITFDPEHHTESGSWERYSTDWSQGGPIIEREWIAITRAVGGHWVASSMHPSDWSLLIVGPTPLVAAMRCFVISKLGYEVDVPKELTTDLPEPERVSRA